MTWPMAATSPFKKTALVWKYGDDLYIQSRDEKPLGRYFPELEVSLRR